MDLERILSQFSTDTYAVLTSNKQRITNKLDTLGLSQKHQQKFSEMIIKIAKITDNPKTRQSYLRSAYRIVTQDITG